MTARPRWTDVQVARAVGIVLRAGVVIAAVVGAIGGAAHLLTGGGAPADYGAFHGEPQRLRSVTAVVHGASRLDPLAVTQLGLLLLIATPVARVALAIVGFHFEGDRRYVAITLLVLTLLLLSLFGRL